QFDLTDQTAGCDYQVQVSSWRSSDTPERGYVIVLNDVTAYKELDRLKSQMIQIASHDLKNPLGVVKGYADLMLMEMDPAHEYHEFVTDISKTTARMVEMVSQLLNVERIEATVDGEQQNFDPLAMLLEIIDELRLIAFQKKQTVKQMFPPGPVTLHGDPPQLREAFKNLLDNALKYTPDGGTIVVQATVDPIAQQFHYAVEDDGYGISAARQQDIFQRFYRAKEPGTESISGTGLGLSLVKAVVERHGGQVWFESSPERGSTFGFWLPLPDGDVSP
ncbi:sensor histidine kinase, partial [Chloroflexota bacterium]